MDGSVAEVELAVPIDPSAVVGFQWPDPFPEIPGIDWGDDGGVLADVGRRGTALNIWAKLWATQLGVASAGAYVEEVLEVRADRLICRVLLAIAERLATAEQDGLLSLVTSAVGHKPPPGFHNGPSYKTPEAFGSLQVSLLEADAGDELRADIDVDEERGFVHAFRAIGHHLTGSKTDPVEVQQILAAQGIDAGWRPLVA